MSSTDGQTLRWFGSSGIRGPPDKVDVDLAMRLGRAVGARWDDLVVARDARMTGPALEAAFIAGALASGAQVTRLGPAPTPAVAWHARDHALGVQVTASHNPAPDNGFKLWTPRGSAVDEEDQYALEAAMDDLPPEADWTGVGREQVVRDGLVRYADAIAAHAGSGALAGFRIALDCAHGAGALVTPGLFTRLGASLRLLGGAPDGRFPDHPSEPTAENLTGLRDVLRAGDFDLGVAHDGDADRTVFLTPDGDLIDPVRLLTVLVARRGDTKVALPVDASGVFQDTHPEVTVTTTPVGDIHLSRAVARGDATAACEPSGTWFFSDWSPAPEGPAAAALIAGWIAKDPRILDDVAALPAYARRSEKVRFPDGMARADGLPRIDEAGARLADTFDPVRVSDVDGARIETDDGWVLVRASGTEPLVRVTAEATSAARADALLTAGRDAVTRALTGGA